MSQILEVPLLEPNSFLTIDIGADLPEDPTEICQLLAAEKCASKWWLAFAAAYARKDATASALQVVSEGLSKAPDIEKEEDKAPFLTLESWLHLHAMRSAPVAQKKPKFDLALEAGNKGYQAYQQSFGNAAQLSIPAVLVQGALVASVGNLNDALQPFQAVLATQPDNIYAKLGRARILYSKANFRPALRLYQEVLRQAPQADFLPDPRIGIGLCYWNLDDRVHARLAWQRSAALHKDSSSSGAKQAFGVAHAMLGVWCLDAALHGVRHRFAENYTQALEHFQIAWRSGTTAMPALKLAAFLFSKHEMVKVGRLSDRVLEVATLPELLSEALLWKARAAHYARDLDSALALYTQATTADSANVAAALGKGIVELSQDRAPEALLTFELVAQAHPRNADALFYSGIFGALRGPEGAPREKARDQLEAYIKLKRGVQESPRPEALVVLSQLCEQQDVTKAYTYLQVASKQIGDGVVPVELNLGVLAFAVHDYAEAQRRFSAVLEGGSAGKYASTAEYNLARTLEAQGHVEEARKHYEALSPRYLDAEARLLLLDGDFAAALPRLRELVEKHSRDLEVRALYGYALRQVVMSGDKDAARAAADAEQDLHKHTLMSVNKRDTYALVALGTIYLAHAAAHGRDADRRKRAYVRAGEFFQKALQLDTHNAYAAQGIAIALAEIRQPELAMPVFARVRETLGDDVSATVNSGHCLMELGDYGRAAEQYAKAQANSPDDSQIEALLARSIYARGVKARDPDQLSAALVWSQRVLDKQPDSAAAQFNVALVRLALGDSLRRRTPELRNVEQLQDALGGVESAMSVLRTVDIEALSFSAEDVEERVDHAESTLIPQLQQAVAEQEQYERQSEARRDEAHRRREAEAAAASAAAERARAEAVEREMRLAAERLKLQEQTAAWEAERQAEREAAAQNEGPKRKKQRRKQERDNSDSEPEAAPSEAENGSDSEPEAKQSDVEPEVEPEARREKAVVGDSDSENDDDEQKDTGSANGEPAKRGEDGSEQENNGQENDGQDINGQENDGQENGEEDLDELF